MTTYYDHRAERTMAEAEADARRAQAEALRVETTLRLERERRQMETDRVQQERRAREERARSRTAQRENRRRQREQTRAARRAAIRRGAGALRTATVQRVPFLVGGVAMGSPIAIAWNGQYQFAEQIMHLGALSPALPIALEGAVWYLAYLTHRAITQHLPTVRYRVATWALAAVAATMNFWHGSAPKGLPANAPQQLIEQATRDAQQTGVALALASLLGIGLWELTVGLTQHTASRRSLTEIRRAAWRRLRYPRLSWQAASIRAARGEDCTIEDAWAAAWVDRYGVGPDAPRRDRRLGRKVTRYQSKADRKAAKDGRLSIVGGQIVGRPSLDPAPADPEGEKAIEQLRSWDGAAATQRAIDRTAVKMLAFGHDFINGRRAASPEAVPTLAPLKPLPKLDTVRADAGPDPLSTLTTPLTDSHTPNHPADEEEREDDREETGNRRTPTEQVNRAAEEWIRARCRGRNGVGRRPSYREVGDRYDRSETWGGNRVRAVQERMAAQGYEFHDDGTVTAPRKPLTESVTAVNGSRSHPETATEVS
ncbi:hypothetical protein [Microbispora rosea]|uniref:hypothetical protein n=1 Tax=Microbispora rosea TaxID=58117 RepID=UPI0004C3078B|nr:hypothetical protein [Microbispora rosea]